MKKYAWCIVCLAIIATALGCNNVKRPDGMPELEKVSVTITQEGKPLEKALVNFRTAEGGGWPIYGTTVASGVAKMCTQSTDLPGVPAGEYIVTVEKVEETPSQYANDPPPTNAEEALALDEKMKNEYRPFYDLVNPEFKTAETSTLKVTVSSKGADPATFEVGAPCREEFQRP